MNISDRLLVQAKARYEDVAKDLNMMQTGERRTYSGGTNTTGESIVRTRGYLTVWGEVIARVEADHAKDAARRLGLG